MIKNICDSCGKEVDEELNEFQGWQHLNDECDMLCDECYETSLMED